MITKNKAVKSKSHREGAPSGKRRRGTGKFVRGGLWLAQDIRVENRRGLDGLYRVIAYRMSLGPDNRLTSNVEDVAVVYSSTRWSDLAVFREWLDWLPASVARTLIVGLSLRKFEKGRYHEERDAPNA